jgi:hypothetical protein
LTWLSSEGLIKDKTIGDIDRILKNDKTDEWRMEIIKKYNVFLYSCRDILVQNAIAVTTITVKSQEKQLFTGGNITKLNNVS